MNKWLAYVPYDDVPKRSFQGLGGPFGHAKLVSPAMTVYLCNSFTLSMIAPSLLNEGVVIKADPISLGEVQALLKEGFVSAVGHESTARVLSKLLHLQLRGVVFVSPRRTGRWPHP
jgi:hypothetical protein